MSLANIKNLQREKGFTIVELLIVIVVIAILVAIVIVAYNGIQNRARTTAAQAAAQAVTKKAEAYNAEEGRYPLTSAEMTGASSTETYYLTGVTFGTPASTATPETVSFLKCGSGDPANQAAITASNITGVKVNYWNYEAGNDDSFGTAGATSGTGIDCPTS